MSRDQVSHCECRNRCNKKCKIINSYINFWRNNLAAKSQPGDGLALVCARAAANIVTPMWLPTFSLTRNIHRPLQHFREWNSHRHYIRVYISCLHPVFLAAATSPPHNWAIYFAATMKKCGRKRTWDFSFSHYWLWAVLFIHSSSHSTHWGLLSNICVSKLTTICSDNGLSPRRLQGII